MASSISRILKRHLKSLEGKLRYRRLKSDTLEIKKGFYIYTPPGIGDASDLPRLYLFRGHEREWVNMEEDASREKSTAIEDLDALIQHGELPPMIAVMPGLNSTDNRIPSLGINMVGDIPEDEGLGSGQFWDFLTDELIPEIDKLHPEHADGPQLLAGFSLGGFTVTNLALRNPGVFSDVAIYDGLFMWPKQQDPRVDKDGFCTDRIWCEGEIFDEAFGKPRKRRAMRRWNPTDRLKAMRPDQLKRIRETTFWIASAQHDGRKGNRDRARFFVNLLEEKDIPLGFDSEEIRFNSEATHTWHWTDRFLVRFLREVFAPETVPSPFTESVS